MARQTVRHFERPGVVHGRVGREYPRLHLRGRRNHLEGTAGRVETLDRVVVEGANFQQLVEGGVGESVDERVEVEGGITRHRQYRAGVGIEHDRGAVLAMSSYHRSE